MFRNNPLDQLKSLKDVPVPPESLDAGRVKLLAFMAAHPLLRVIPIAWWKRAFVWKPAAAFAMMTMAASGSGMAVSAAEGSVPGDSLYRVKMLAEAVGTKLTFSPEAQFRGQAMRAERRLDEAAAVMQLTDDSPESRQERLKVTMQKYQAHLAALNDIAARLNVNAEVDAEQANLSATVAAREVERVLERHESLVESASASVELDETFVSSAMPARELEDKVLKRLEKLRARTHDMPAHGDADVEGAHGASDHDGHDHVDAEAPTVDIPFVNQARINLRREVRAGLKTNINVDNASTR